MNCLFKKRVLRLISSVLVFAVFAVSAPAVYSQPGDDSSASADARVAGSLAESSGFSPVLSQSGLTLYFNQATAEVALYSAKSNRMLYSNPQDIPEGTTGTLYHRMLSQLYITYYENNSQVKYYSSYFDSLNRNQVTFRTENGVLSVNYVFGKKKIQKEMLPAAIPKDKFEKKVLASLDDSGKLAIKEQYKLISTDDMITEKKKQEYRETYQNFDDTALYILNSYIPEYEVEGIYDLLFSGEYKQSDFTEDNKASGNEVEIKDQNIVFDLTLLYSLEEGALKVELDCSKLTVLENASISSVNILEFFGCGGTEDSGYVLIPDGCGGLVNFNQGEKNVAAFSGAIYGKDLSVKTNQLDNSDVHIQLPVLGIQKNEGGMLAVAETGAEYCSINADIADETVPYNVGYFRADINPHDEMSVANPISGGGLTQVYVHQKTPYQGKIEVRYYPLEDGKSTYCDMAVFYRELLKKEGVLTKKLEGKIPFVYGLVGAINVKKHFLGIPYTGMQTLTTFKQAEEIINEFSDAGIANQKIKYDAWCNEGMKQTSVAKLNVLGCLGGRKKLKELFENKHAVIYPNVRLTQTSNTVFDGFSVKKDAARLTYDEAALLYPVNISKNYFDYDSDYTYIVSPVRYDKILNGFFKKYNYGTILLGDITSELNSDFAKDRYTDRSASLSLSKSAIEKISGHCDIMVSEPNLYAVKYTALMTDIPVSTSGANIISREVPFFQIVFSGYADLVSDSVNISSGDFSSAHLMAFSTMPSYTFSFRKSSAVIDTDYASLYSLCYQDWIEQAVENYKRYSAELSGVRGQSIVRHETLDNGLTEVCYENGGSFLINNTSSDIYYDGQTVSAGSYVYGEAK